MTVLKDRKKKGDAVMISSESSDTLLNAFDPARVGTWFGFCHSGPREGYGLGLTCVMDGKRRGRGADVPRYWILTYVCLDPLDSFELWCEEASDVDEELTINDVDLFTDDDWQLWDSFNENEYKRPFSQKLLAWLRPRR